ncbi:transcription factor [Salix suchowensis]|nr:transcription factor [Salix suchowensis]
MKDHTKVISALALDPSGARILSGSHDYDCKLWDFGGMDYRCKPFKPGNRLGRITYVPTRFKCFSSTHFHLKIHDVKYSIDGQRFLVVSGTTQAKLYDRDGEEEYVCSDFSIGWMASTDWQGHFHQSGHVFELSSCAWHPKNPETFITAPPTPLFGMSYVYVSSPFLKHFKQIWEVENKRKQKSVIVVKSKERGARTKVTSCAYSPDGNIISGVWDLRAFKKPLAVRSDIGTLYPNTNAMFSPDDKYVITGAAATTKGGKGRLLFMEKDALNVAKTLDVDSTPVKIVTGLSSGQICVLYSPQTSLNGAKLLLSKGPPRKVTIEDMSDALAAPTIITPHALPMFRDGDGIARGSKRKREKDRLDPRKSRRPELPVTGPGRVAGPARRCSSMRMLQSRIRNGQAPGEQTNPSPFSQKCFRKRTMKRSKLMGLCISMYMRGPERQREGEMGQRNGDLRGWPCAGDRTLIPRADNFKRRQHHDDDKVVVDVVLNGADNEKPNGVNGVDSPNADSPTTPVSSSAIPDVKIDIDYQEQESDVRHEPIPVKIIKPVAMVQHASAQLLAESPVDLGLCPFLPLSWRMSEASVTQSLEPARPAFLYSPATDTAAGRHQHDRRKRTIYQWRFH